MSGKLNKILHINLTTDLQLNIKIVLQDPKMLLLNECYSINS